ncbi:SCO1860 family LAETG-anchored protein [Kitasatospora sp. NPDC005748]|uniref:SCO1860 family LAETG-anchored protein n=1 Tax=Kitasatospora sp. NPDC005748 TaxID=3157063 RepID=UPI0033E6688F
MSSSRSTSFAGSAVAAVVASALVVAPVLVVTPVAHATGPTPAPAGSTAAAAAPTATAGRARAVTVELALDVQLLSKVDVPVNLALNKVESPAQREGSLLTAKVDGVDQQGPVTLVKADVGTSVVKSDAKGTAASVKLVNADVHAPGLPATTLLGLEALSSSVTCPVDGPPTADVTAPAKLTVLGKPVTLSLYGPTDVDVPLVGRVSVEFSKRATTSTTAAASALEVRIEVNPLNLNVAKVTGKITVASVSCEKPTAPVTPTPSVTPTAPGTAPAVQPAVDATSTPPGRTARPQATATAAGGNLAATGGSDATGPLAAGAAALVAVGGGALWVTRRRAAHARKH